MSETDSRPWVVSVAGQRLVSCSVQRVVDRRVMCLGGRSIALQVDVSCRAGVVGAKAGV